MRSRIVLLVMTLAVTAACAGLGFWQLRRMTERGDYNARLIARSSQAPLDADAKTLTAANAYRRTVATGEYDVAREIILRARSLNGRAGNHVLTPLRLASGVAVIVDRGWVPFEENRPPVESATPPKTAGVRGIIVPAEPPRKERSGTLETIGSIDVSRIQRQIPYAIAPVYIALQTQDPPQASLPAAAGLPPPGEGPHLSYAVQWFIFGAIAMTTGVLLARRDQTGKEVTA